MDGTRTGLVCVIIYFAVCVAVRVGVESGWHPL